MLSSIRVKFVAFASIAFIASGLAFGAVFARQRAEVMRLEFQKRGEILVRSLAASSRLALWAGDRESLERQLEGFAGESDVAAVAVYDATLSRLVARENVAGSLGAPPDRPNTEEILIRNTAVPDGEGVISLRKAVYLGRQGASLVPGEEPQAAKPVGVVEVVLGLTAIENEIRSMQLTSLTITGVIVALGVLAVLLLSRIFVTPIEEMAAVARRVAGGDRNARALVGGRDELGELARAFNGMTASLAAHEEELRQMNLGLEQKVGERTAELELKQKELVAANVELERANRLKSEFLANMSHELRTPLNAVNGFSELLLEELHGPLSPKQKRYVENILTSGRHLLQLINDILDLSKIEAGRMEVHREPFSLRQTVENAASVIQPLAQKKGIAIELSIDPGLDLIVLDPGKTRQILYNLMSNAVKFTDMGKVSVVASKLSPERMEISVADTGIGIKEEDMGRIFREFEQLDGSHSRKYEGTGLGLALTRKLIELQGGSIRVESKAGVGSRFIVDLPIAAKPAAAARV